MNNSVDHVAIKLVHIMFCKGMIDADIYRQVLAKIPNKSRMPLVLVTS